MTRWMKRWGWIGGLVFLAIPATAATLTGKFGTLSGTITTATATTDTILVDGQSSLVVYIANAGTTIGTTVAQCQQSGDGAGWTNVGSTAAAVGVICNVTNPVGFYRVNVTTCTGCTLVIGYRSAHAQ